MKRFGYLRDPLCLVACALYALNRFWFRSHLGGPFLTGYFNDLLFIPAALPIVLWVQRRLGVRENDHPPHWREIALHLIVWSVVAEGLMPHLSSHAIGDWQDVLAYASGAVAAGIWWHSGGIA